MATIKKHFSYNNGVRDISLVNDLKCLSESLTEILNGEFLQKKWKLRPLKVYQNLLPIQKQR